MTGLWLRLKQRKLVQWSLAYLAAAWVMLQALGLAAGSYAWPAWVMRIAFGAVALGFVLTLVFAWYHGERGEQKVRGTELLIVALLLAIGGGLLWKFTPTTQSSATHVAAQAAISAPRSAAVNAVPPATVVPARSIAILPFVNDSGDPDQRYFSDGLSENLIIALSQYPTLTVIGRESSFRLRNTKLDSKQIGAKLGVANLLEGSVSREGGKVRVRAELVSTANGRTLWSNRYDRPYQNLFALQDDITQAVAEALKAKLLGSAGAVVQSDRPQNGSLAAYNAYLVGNFYVNQFTQASVRKAIDYYRRAIAADPKYAAAYAKLAFAWSILGGYYNDSGTSMAQAEAKGRSAVDTALKLDPNLATAYIARGRLLKLTLDLRGAEAAYRHALVLDPSSADAKQWLAQSLASLGRLDEAIRIGREAIAANPLNPLAYSNLSWYLAADGQLTAAAKSIERTQTFVPGEYYGHIAAIEVLRGNPSAALNAAQTARDPSWRLWALALAYQAAGKKIRADQALGEFIAKYADYMALQVADLYANRGDPDQVFTWLDRAWSEHDPGVGTLLYDPFLLRYKDDPRFTAFCRKVGLPVPGSTAAVTAN